MTDPAERRSQVPPGSAEPSPPARDTEPDALAAPRHSYINELRARIDSLPDADDHDALMIPPGASPQRWVATDIESALHAAAETVPRRSSLPDAPDAEAIPRVPTFDSALPPAELSSRHVRRPARELVDDFPVELEGAFDARLRARDRGRKSGRFTTPAGLRASLEEGTIAAAVKGLVDAERAFKTPAHADGVVPPAPETHAVRPPEPASPPPERASALSDEDGAVTPSRLGTATRVIALFATASIAGGTAIYFLLRG